MAWPTLWRSKKDKDAAAEPNQRGSVYQQSSPWHMHASSMLGTKTANFEDVTIEDEEQYTASSISSIIKSPFGFMRRRSDQELEWKTRTSTTSVSGSADAAVAAAAVKSLETKPSTPQPGVVSSKSWFTSGGGGGGGGGGGSGGGAAEAVPTRPCIVELLKATNLPSVGSGPAGGGSSAESSSVSPSGGGVSSKRPFARNLGKEVEDLGGTHPFVTMKIIPRDVLQKQDTAREKGKERRWPYKNDTCYPIWNKARDLGRFCEGDTIRISLHHHSKGSEAQQSRLGTLLGPAKPIVYSHRLGGCDGILQKITYGTVWQFVLDTKLSKEELEAHAGLRIHMPVGPTVLHLRFLAPPKPLKTVFVVRHAESKWNRAQKRNDLVAMANVDHGLSQAGRDQAEQLWRRLELEACEAGLLSVGYRDSVVSPKGQAAAVGRATPVRFDSAADAVFTATVKARSREESRAAEDNFRRFWAADDVWASPLTRATQTALIGLQGHPALVAKGLRLSADAREVKGIGGLDSIGRARGSADVLARLGEEMLELYSAKACPQSDDPAFSPSNIVKALLRPVEVVQQDPTIGPGGPVAQAAGPKLNADDANDEWWTGAFNSDKSEDVDVRLNELLNAIKFSSGDTLILVSHSNILKDLMGRRVNKELRAAKPDLTRTAGKCKLHNCSVVRLDLDFTMDLAHCIVGLEPLFVRDDGDAFERHKAKGVAASPRGDEGGRLQTTSQPRPADSSSRPRPLGDGSSSAGAGSGGQLGDQQSGEAALDLAPASQAPALLLQRNDAC